MPRRDWCASARPADSLPQGPATLSQSVGRAPPRRPAVSVVYRTTGRGREGPWLTRTRTRARARRLRVLACNTHNAGAVPRHEASPPRIRTAHAVRTSCVFCGGARVPAARRVERASQRRLSDVAAQWQRRSTRALTMFSAGNRRRRARGGEQGPAEVVYLCWLPIWGQPLARWRPCRPSVAPG